MPTQSQCALWTMQKLSWSYLDRLAASDSARAAIVFQQIRRVYNSKRDLIAEAIGIPVSRLPRSVPTTYGQEAQLAVGLSLDAAFIGESGEVLDAAAHQAITQHFPREEGALGAFFTSNLSARVPASSAIRDYVDATQLMPLDQLERMLAQTVDRHLSCQIASSTQVAAAPTPVTPVRTSSPVRRAPIELDPILVQGDARRSALPTWAKYVLGAGAIAMIGTVIYQSAR